jgi:hypothetical protein
MVVGFMGYRPIDEQLFREGQDEQIKKEASE